MRIWTLPRRIGLLLIGRAKLSLEALPRPTRMKRCSTCKNWTAIFCAPCPDCGCTGEAEYEYRKARWNYYGRN